MKVPQQPWLVFFLVLFGLALSAEAGAIGPGSGAALCDALSPADFQAVGISQATPPKANVQENGASAYCIYAGKSSATGGLELDIFYPAGGNPTEVKGTYDTSLSESSTVWLPISVPGVDEAKWFPKALSGGPAFATLALRRGNLVMVLGIPAGPNAQAQLLKLVDVALKRLK